MATTETIRNAEATFEAIQMPSHTLLRNAGNNFYAGLHKAFQRGNVTQRELIALGERLHYHADKDEEKLKAHVAKAEKMFNSSKNAMLAYRTLRETLRESNLPTPRSWKNKLLLSTALAGAIAGTVIGAKTSWHSANDDKKSNPTEVIKKEPARAVMTKPSLKSKSEVRPKSELQTEVEAQIATLRRRNQLKKADEVSVLVQDLDSGKTLVGINPDQQRMAASLVKTYVMLASYDKLSRGAKPPARLERDIRAMIQHSNNGATNRVIRFVGGPEEVDKIVKRYGFQHTEVVEEIPPNHKTYKNKTSASDLNKLLTQIHGGQLINQRYSAMMLDHLDSYEESRIERIAELGNQIARFEGELSDRKKTLNLAGKTGYVFGLNGEATRVTFRTPTGKRHYNFIAIVQNKEVRTIPRASELDWIPPTSGAIRDIFRRVHRHMEQN